MYQAKHQAIRTEVERIIRFIYPDDPLIVWTQPFNDGLRATVLLEGRNRQYCPVATASIGPLFGDPKDIASALWPKLGNRLRSSMREERTLKL